MMNGIGGPYDLYNIYNRISNVNIRQQQVETPVQEPQQEVAAAASGVQEMDLNLSAIKPRENAPLEDISLSLSTSPSFEMKGRNSDIESLDLEKAVSDMQKDQVLQQYQYFIGDSAMLSQDEDGIVLQKIATDMF